MGYLNFIFDNTRAWGSAGYNSFDPSVDAGPGRRGLGDTDQNYVMTHERKIDFYIINSYFLRVGSIGG